MDDKVLTPKDLGYYTLREAEFREAQRKWIIAQDLKYREIEEKYSQVPPLRHPKDQTFDRHTREYLWTDALWCQDRGTDCFEEFYEVDFYKDINEDSSGPVWEWAVNIFDEEFRKLYPELGHVLEG